MGGHRYFLKSGVLFHTTILNLFWNSLGFLLLLHSPVLSLGCFLLFVVVCLIGFLCGRHELGSPSPPSCWHHSPEYFCVIVQGNTEEKPSLWFVFEPDLSFSTTLTKVVLKSSLIGRQISLLDITLFSTVLLARWFWSPLHLCTLVRWWSRLTHWLFQDNLKTESCLLSPCKLPYRNLHFWMSPYQLLNAFSCFYKLIFFCLEIFCSWRCTLLISKNFSHTNLGILVTHITLVTFQSISLLSYVSYNSLFKSPYEY